MADITARRNLNPCRRQRTFPRVVKRTRRNSYPAKRATDIGARHTRPPTIRIIRTTPTDSLITTS